MILTWRVLMAQPTETNLDREQERELWGLVQQASRAMQRAMDAELRPIGITSAEAAILYFIRISSEPVTPAMLSRWLIKEAHTVSAILGRMEKQGLVNKKKNLPRKNLVRVALTEKGAEATAQASETKVMGNILFCLSPEEQDTLGEFVERLRNKAIEEYQEEPRWCFP
jgi:DNA-binding MarR family transcriptional regulator